MGVARFRKRLSASSSRRTNTPVDAEIGQPVLAMQSVFVKLVVDAAWRDPEKPGRL
jgi:hypothetical protein